MFILVVLEWGGHKELVPITREWLPRLLPHLNELGSLHVHYGRGARCWTVDDGFLRHDELGCLT